MKNYISEIFGDVIRSIVTRKYGSSMTDAQREQRVQEYIQQLHDANSFTVEMTQSIIDKKGINNFYTTNIGGTPVYALIKEGMFRKAKICYFVTRNKDIVNNEYLDQVYEELRKQAAGDNIFNSPNYANKA